MPERVRALVNVEGFGLRDSNASDAPLRYRQWIEAGRELPRFSTYASFSELARRVRRRNPQMGAAESEFVARCWAEEHDGQVRLRVDPLHKLPNAVLYRRSESEACWQSVTADVLLVVGSDSELLGFLGNKSGLGPVQDVYSSAATVTAATIADAGHMMHFEAPAALAAQIEGFLCKHL
jgi:pimeloyl-ACP methyl ester carboxylesterase